MTQRNLLLGGFIVLLLAIALETGVILYVNAQHHSQSTERIINLERDVNQLRRESV